MNFKDEVDVAGYRLQSYEQCDQITQKTSVDHGGLLFGTGYGFTVRRNASC